MRVRALFVVAWIGADLGVLAVATGAGCSSPGTSSVPIATDGVRQDDGGSGAPDSSTAALRCPAPEPPITQAEIEAMFQWKPPAAPRAVCTQKNIDDVRSLVPSNSVSRFADIRAALGPDCAACVFSKDTDANWQVFVETGSRTLDNAFPSCAAQRGCAACGEALFESRACGDLACPADCPYSNPGSLGSCRSDAYRGRCSTLSDRSNTLCFQRCPAFTDSTACDSALAAIVESCANASDGGIDASTQ